MTSLTDPKSNVHTFAYDSLGRLKQDTDPTGASIGLQSTMKNALLPAAGGIEPLVSWSTAVTSGAGHVTNHEDFTLSNGSRQRVAILPSGATRTSIEASSSLWTTADPDGTFTSTQLAPDPQFGMLDAYVGGQTRTTPSGISYGLRRTRTSTGSPLAPSQILDLMTMNGTSTWSSIFTAATGGQPGQWLYVSPANRQRVEQLDSLGRVTSVSYPGTTTLPTTSFVYDADGRVQTVTVTANGGASTRTTSMTYDQFLAG